MREREETGDERMMRYRYAMSAETVQQRRKKTKYFLKLRIRIGPDFSII
jgi:hypothetical protein